MVLTFSFPFPQGTPQSSSQSVRPGRLTGLGRYTLHTLHAHWQQKFKNVLKFASKIHSFVLPPPNDLVTTVHLQFAFPAQFWTSESPLPHGLPMQNSSYPVVSGALNNMRCQFPIRTTTHSRPALNLRDANKVCCSFIPSVQNFMPCECPVNVRRRAHNGSAEFSKMVEPLPSNKFHCIHSRCELSNCGGWIRIQGVGAPKATPEQH